MQIFSCYEIIFLEKLSKRKRERCLEDERHLRVKKLKDSIQQQRELYILKMAAVEAEKSYWERKVMLIERKF